MCRTHQRWIGHAVFLTLLATIPTAKSYSADAQLQKDLASAQTKGAEIPSRPLPMVSRRQIFQAIQNELALRGISAGGRLRPEELNIQASVPAMNGDQRLQVKSIHYRPLRGDVVFDLWAPQEPHFLPFEVAVRNNRDLISKFSVPPATSASVAAPDQDASTAPALRQRRSKALVLATPGTLATLLMVGQNIRITTAVVPLQPGVLGQAILVRDVSTARVMTAEVVDRNLLRINL